MSPQRLRLYLNQPSGVGFDEAESIKPHLDIALLQGQSYVTEYPLRVAAFSNVFSISLFLVSLPFQRLAPSLMELHRVTR
jgi:hypothetical protein